MTQRPLLFLGLITWSVLVLFTPATVHLRDSGEFLLTAFALDIPHPAGFPTYAQLANLFALIPLGPIAWRINAFSTAMIFLTVALSWYLSFRLISKSIKLRESLAAMLALIAPIILLGSSATIHQAYAAEVYGLNTAILLTLLLCYERWLHSDDKRFLYLAAFLAALGLGNHVSLAASVVLMLPLVIIDRRKIGVAIPISVLFGLVGLAVYSYLPVRASVPRPLMVATPDTFERFVAHVTDQRDRELRPEALPFASTDSLIERLGNDVTRISAEVGALAIILGALGGYLLFKIERRLAWGLISILLGNWFFFLGWDPDPWVPTFAVLAVLSSVTLGYFTEKVARSQERALLANALVLLALVVSLSSFSQLSVGELREIRDNSFVRDQAKRLVVARSSDQTLIVEPSWFIVRYLQQIEKFRDDLTIVYLPTILFPKFFSSVQLSLNASMLVSTTADDAGSPDQRMSRFISIASRFGSITIEPVTSINRLISEVARFSADGVIELLRGKLREIETGYASAAIEQISYLHKSAQETPLHLRADSQQYVETLAATRAALLNQVGEKSLAGDLLLASCGSIENPLCSGAMLNNLAAHYINLGEYDRALKAAETGLEQPGAPRGALLQNLNIARAASSATKAVP